MKENQLLSKVDGSDNINAAWITKYDPTGHEIWSKAFAGEREGPVYTPAAR